jgi:hypothetical protein
LYDRANASIHAAFGVKRTLRRLDPAGEKQNQPFQLSSNPSLKVDFQGSRVTPDGGLLLVRELDEPLGLAEGHRTRRRFGATLGRIALLPVPTGQKEGG